MGFDRWGFINREAEEKGMEWGDLGFIVDFCEISV